jgi:DeoR family transcriptional regulator, aga operon transcriptional repressor
MPQGSNGGASATARRTRMLNALRTREFLRVNELGEMFGVSEVTVRGDLDALAARGEVRRVHGGAMPLVERSFEDSSGANAAEKQAIGEAAAGLVESGSLVALDVGTTAMAVARALTARPELEGVMVLTNALNIALELEHAYPHVSVVVTGGTLRPLQHSLVQPLADRVMAGLNPDLAIVSCNGIDAERGVTNVNLPEAEIKRAMLTAARRRVIVADGSKLGAVASAHVWDAAGVDLLLTGESAPADVVESLRALGPEVRVVA